MANHKAPILKRLMQSKLFIIFEIAVLVIFSAALAKEIFRKHQVQGDIKKLQEELATLDQKNAELNSLIQYFNSDTYKEEQARLKLGLQKPGESVVAVLGDSTANNANEYANQLAANPENKNVNPMTNPQRWYNYFFQTKKEKRS